MSSHTLNVSLDDKDYDVLRSVMIEYGYGQSLAIREIFNKARDASNKKKLMQELTLLKELLEAFKKNDLETIEHLSTQLDNLYKSESPLSPSDNP